MAEGIPVFQALAEGARRLRQAGIEEARVNVELLLCHVLGTTRLRLLLDSQRPLSGAEAAALEELLQQRCLRRPLQHLIGTAPFLVHTIEVTPDVLIPRPETEVLVQEALACAKTRPTAELRVLDFATGSGCIAIALAAKSPTTRVVALDVSTEALAMARQNAAHNKVMERLEFRHGDGFAAMKSGERFDLIVSNPPYIASAEIETLQPEVRDHDPRGALDGGADGLDFYRRLAAEAGDFLQPHGKLMLEFGEGQAEAIRTILSAAGWSVEAIHPDYTQRLRYLVAHR